MRKINRVRPITPPELHTFSDDQIVRLIPSEWREFYPGKNLLNGSTFYLYDGMVWNLFTAQIEDQP